MGAMFRGIRCLRTGPPRQDYMGKYQPIRTVFDISGIDCVHPPDRLAPDKLPYALNIRSVVDGGFTSRPGYGAPLNATPFSGQCHSIRRLNSTIPGSSPTSRRFVGAGTTLYSVDAGQIDTGYSGNPLSLVTWRPDQSPAPWMYVYDSQRMQKCQMNAAQTHYNIGIAPPTVAPTVELSTPGYTIVDDFLSASGWAETGTSGAPTEITRNLPSATIGYILYDSGSTGWANISPTNTQDDYHWIGGGARLALNSGGGDAETIIVQEVHLQVSNSTISGIVYDSGSTGLCTIQAANPLAGISRESMLLLNSGGGTAEAVRVLSIAEGPDGLYSFRCSTVNNHAATETLTGLASFRCYCANTHSSTETITGGGLTFGTTKGIGSIYKLSNLDLSQAAGRPLTRDDIMHISVWVDNPNNLIEARIMLNISGSDTSFDTDWYYFSFQPAFNSAAISGSQTSLQALQTAATNALLQDVTVAIPSAGLTGATQPAYGTPGQSPIGQYDAYGTYSSVDVPASEQLYAGSEDWTEIYIPFSALTRIGADATRSIANVNAIGLWVNCSGTVNIQASAWWVGGGYGPNTLAATAQPLLYRYRYRSKETGAKSQQSPATRSTLQVNPNGSINGSTSGLIAQRQQVAVTAALSADPQVDQIDFERFGGVNLGWNYVGTLPNTGTPTFLDTYADADIVTNPPLETDAVMPWPSFDIPRSGTCNVVGTQVTWISGDQFNTSWAPGQEILINGIPYTVYGQPGSATSLATVENVDVLTNVPFLVAEPVLIGQPLPYVIGPFSSNFLLGWGDPRNPGLIYATKGGDPDSAPLNYYLELSSPSEPIVGGVIFDDNAIVASTKRFWRVSIDPQAVASGQGNVLTAVEIPVGRGLFSPWAICAGPVIWFLGDDGVPYATTGSAAASLVENDLRPLFPHDGGPGIGFDGFEPPDLTQTTKLRFSYVESHLRFDYQDTNAVQRTLLYDPARKGWLPDQYTVPMNLGYWEEGQSLTSELLLGQDGNVYQVGGFSDNGYPIPVTAYTPVVNGGNPRTEKFWSDQWLDADPQGATNLSLIQGFYFFTQTFPAITVGAGQTGRGSYPLDINSQQGILGQNAQVQISWSSATAAPVIYEWQAWAEDTGTVLRTSWASLPTSHGLKGYQHVRDGYLPVYLPNAGTVNLVVTCDGQVQATIPFNPSAGRLQKLRWDFPPNPNKALMFQYNLNGVPVLVFEKDLEVTVKAWGSAGPYQNLKPFGDSP